LSLDAFQASVADVCRTALAASPVGVDGAAVSGHAAVVTLLVAVLETLPAASTAATPRVYAVPQVKPLNA
jgi:hypothetical protein